MKFPLAYDATTTREDFVRVLPQATGETELREIDGSFRGRGWSIRLTPIPPLTNADRRRAPDRPIQLISSGFRALRRLASRA